MNGGLSFDKSFKKSIAGIRRSKVEVNDRFGMMHTVVFNLFQPAGPQNWNLN